MRWLIAALIAIVLAMVGISAGMAHRWATAWVLLVLEGFIGAALVVGMIQIVSDR